MTVWSRSTGFGITGWSACLYAIPDSRKRLPG
jgi:hypothetical protein